METKKILQIIGIITCICMCVACAKGTPNSNGGNETGEGNTSRTDFYSEEEGQYNLIHFKIDLQETFDDEEYYDEPIDWSDDEEGRKARKDRTFATLENIELRWNKCDDGTYIREYAAYEMYREQGLLAPHTNLASTDVGGNHQGVFFRLYRGKIE